jgi:hypothetical protein
LRLAHVFQNPAQLGGRKVRVQRQPGQFQSDFLGTLGFEFCYEIGCALILPDDGIVYGKTTFAVPGDDGLTLIIDADGVNIE